MRASEKSGRSSKRGWKWLILGFACVALFVLRHNLAGLAVDALLRQIFSSERGATFAYADVHWDGRAISVGELDIETLEYRLAVQRLEIVLEFSFSPFGISPHIWIVRPYVIFQGSEMPSSEAGTLAAPFALLDWIRLDIVEGRCEWTPRENAASEELFLQFVSGTAPHAIGMLELFATPEMNQNPLIRASVAKQSGEKRGLFLHWESQKLATHHLLPLLWTAFGRAVTGWERIEGGWELKGSLALDEKGAVLDLQSSLSVADLELRNIELGLHVAARNISLNLQQRLPDPAASAGQVPWYQRIEAHAMIEEGEIECTQPFAEHPWGITHVDGRMSWCEKEDPVFSLRGVTIQQDGEKELFVQGTGSLGNEYSFWLQTYLIWGPEEKPLLETTLSLCSPEPASFVIEAQVSELQMNAALALGSLFGLPREQMERFHFGQGTLKGIVTAWMEDECVERIELRDVGYDKVAFLWKEVGQAENLSGSLEGSWRRSSSGWSNNHFIASFHLAEFQPTVAPKGVRVVDVEGECVLEGERIVRAAAKARIGELPFLCTCEGPTNACRLSLSSDTNLSACLKTFSPASAAFDLGDAKHVELQMRVHGIPNFTHGSPINGSIFVKNNDEPAKEIALEGTFDKKGMELHIDIPRLQIVTPLIGVELLPHKEKRTRGTFTAVWEAKEFRFLLPLTDARCTLPSFNLHISQVRALLELGKNQFLLKDLHANCEGIALQGHVQIDGRGISLCADKIKGRFEDLENVCVKATRRKYLAIGMSGEFSSGAEGFLFEAPLDLSHCSTLALQTTFSSLRVPLHKDGSLEDVSGMVAYDSRQNTLKFGEMRGALSTPSAEFGWAVRPAIFTKTAEHWEGTLDASLNQDHLELVRLVSLLRFSGNSLAFASDPQYTHLLGCPIEKAKGIITPDFFKCHCHINWDLEQLPALRELVCDTTVVQQKDLPNSEFLKAPSLGLLHVALDYDSTVSLFQFSLEGQQVQIFGVPCPALLCQGKKMAQAWTFTDCRFGDHRLQFDLNIRNFELVVPAFSGTIAGLQCRGSATCSLPKYQWQCQLHSLQIPVGKQFLNFQTKQPLIVDYSDHHHCLVKNILLEEADGLSQLACPEVQIDWQEKSYRAHGTQHLLTPKFMKRLLPPALESLAISPEDPLNGTLHVDGNWQGGFTYQVQGVWKECLFQFGEKKIPVQKISGRYREGALLLGGKLTIGQLPAAFSLQIDQDEETLGVFKLQESDHPDSALSLFFRVLKNGTFEPSHITGEFSGIKPQLRKKGPHGILHLYGGVEIDFAKVRQLFPRDVAPLWQSLQLGKGFTLEGDFLYQHEKMGFQGEVRGAQCELLGCHIQGLSTALTIEPQRLKFEKLQIVDPALTLTVRRLTLEETALGKIWTLSCPTLQVREFQPSRLKKIGKQPSTEKPFVVRNFTLTNLMGDLNNPKSVVGECSLHFTNTGKKEAGLFDIPLDFLKDLGLEPSVLIPIQGEFDGHFESGRLLFTSLKGSYSEGRRTQFILSDRGDGSYIDFQGNLHIDLAVKQAVLLKIAESLNLGIRGSVDKPRYIILP